MQAQETNSRSFIKQYSGKEGYTVVTVNRTAIKLASLLTRMQGAPKEELTFLSGIEEVQVLSLSWHKDRTNALEKAFLTFCETDGYDSILESEESGEIVRIYCSFNDRAINGFIIWSREAGNVNVVFLNGCFTFEDMKVVMDKKGGNLRF
jgi:hypothetical protein